MTPTTAEPWDVGRPVAGYRWRRPGNQDAVLLQHGFGEYARRFETQYQHLIPRLVEAGFDVYAIDMRGHGQSPGRRAVVDVNDAVRDHLAARRALPHHPRLFLYGHSLGGLVTAASVVEDPDGAAGVILSSAALPSTIRPAARIALRLLATVAPYGTAPTPAADISGLSRLPAAITAAREDPDLFKGRLSNRVADTSVGVCRRILSAASQWKVPTLVLHGADDTYTEPEGSVRLFNTITSPDKSLTIIPDGRHELLNDDDGPQILSETLSWLQDRMTAK
jgi:acylglycerol lipase